MLIFTKMKNLIKYFNQDRTIILEDYFGQKHTGKIIVERNVNPNDGRERRYFFVRKDGAKIRIYHKGSARVMEEEENRLKLSLRNGYGQHLTPQEFNPRQEALDSLKFENMREA